jgi:hypothetical protein
VTPKKVWKRENAKAIDPLKETVEFRGVRELSWMTELNMQRGVRR